MLPIVFLVSTTAGFSAKYPFLQIYNGDPYISSRILIWELIYFLQFFGLEFFFRGFLAAQLETVLGILFDLCDDGAVLHDPFRQAAGRNARRDPRRNFSRLAELSEREHLAWAYCFIARWRFRWIFWHCIIKGCYSR